jgi:hypothetical protein
MERLGNLTITNIGYDQAKSISEAQFGSMVWMNGKAYPLGDVVCDWQDNVELRQQLAEQTSDHIVDANKMVGVQTIDAKAAQISYDAGFDAGKECVEVLLEALRYIKDGNCATLKSAIIHANDALNAYSSKPQKHLDN